MDVDELAAYRLSRGWTWAQLAEQLGISQATLYNMQAGKRVTALTRARIRHAIDRLEAAQAGKKARRA